MPTVEQETLETLMSQAPSVLQVREMEANFQAQCSFPEKKSR